MTPIDQLILFSLMSSKIDDEVGTFRVADVQASGKYAGGEWMNVTIIDDGGHKVIIHARHDAHDIWCVDAIADFHYPDRPYTTTLEGPERYCKPNLPDCEARQMVKKMDAIIQNDENDSWETIYDNIFSEEVSMSIFAKWPGFSYYDPGTSYYEDVMALFYAFKEYVHEKERARHV